MQPDARAEFRETRGLLAGLCPGSNWSGGGCRVAFDFPPTGPETPSSSKRADAPSGSTFLLLINRSAKLGRIGRRQGVLSAPVITRLAKHVVAARPSRREAEMKISDGAISSPIYRQNVASRASDPSPVSADFSPATNIPAAEYSRAAGRSERGTLAVPDGLLRRVVT